MAPHLSFVDTPDPDSNVLPSGVVSGWNTISRAVGSTHVVMTTDSAHEDLARQVLATAHVVTHDANGCAVTSPIQAPHAVRPDPTFDVTRLTRVDSIAVCQYRIFSTEKPGLIASRQLTGEAARDELAALQAAPTGGGPERPDSCLHSVWDESGLVLRLTTPDSATHDMYAYYDGCFDNGIDDGTNVRELTVGNCRSLWSDRVIDMGGIPAVFHRCSPPRR